MSWIDRINNIQLTITTGGGSVFTPLFKSPTRNRGFNASVFNFNDIEGSLVRRGKAESMKYPIEFHFTGDDHIDEAERFNLATLDIRPWTISHPNYGDVLVQPISLNFNDSGQNDTIVTGELFETIEDTFPDSKIDVQENVLSSVENAVTNQEEIFNIESPSQQLANSSYVVVEEMTEEYKRKAITDIDLQAVQAASNASFNSLVNITSDPLTFMRNFSELVRTPAKFYSRVNDRVAVLKESYEDLKQSIGIDSDNDTKLLFETTGGILVSAMAEASVIQTQEIADDQFIEDNTIEDYTTRSNVIDIVDLIRFILGDYLNYLGTLQSEIDATPESYTPQQSSINATKEAVTKATGQLLQIAVQTKQERKYTLSEPAAIIIIVHRLLGTTEDQEIRTFSENNQILLGEWLQLPKGREVIYYV